MESLEPGSILIACFGIMTCRGVRPSLCLEFEMIRPMTRKTLPLKWLIITGLLLLVAGGVAAWAYFQSMTSGLTLSGEVQAREIRLASRFGGRVRSVYAHEGDTVRPGQLLVL